MDHSFFMSELFGKKFFTKKILREKINFKRGPSVLVRSCNNSKQNETIRYLKMFFLILNQFNLYTFNLSTS